MDRIKKLVGAITVMKIDGIKPNFSEVARQYNVDRRTVAKYWKEGEYKVIKRKACSKFDPYYDEIIQKLSSCGASVKAVFMYFKNKYGDDTFNNYWTFYSFCKSRDIRPVTGRIPHVRYETDPGEQLQVDWKEDLKMELKSGEIITFNLFAATLGYSRFHYFIYSRSRTTEDFLRCLIEVLYRIGGMPKHILTDNMAAIVSITNGTKKKHEIIRQFEKDTEINIKLCRVRTPQTKGKVESSNRFVEWLKPYNREFEREESIIKHLEKFMVDINNEVNQTTQIPPVVLMRKEKEHLSPIPNKLLLESYLKDVMTKTVPETLLIQFDGKGYSVPQKYIGKRVKAVPVDNKLYIYFNTTLICIHEISTKKINYAEEHYTEALSSTMKGSEDEICKKARENLERLGMI